MSAALQFTQFLEKYLSEVVPLAKECALAYWDQAVTGAEEHALRAADLSAALTKINARTDSLALLQSISPDTLTDPMLKRQHDILLRTHRASQADDGVIERLATLEAEVAQVYNNYRAVADNKELSDNDVREVLKTATDNAARRQVWEASKHLGALVSERVLEMVRLRNEAARKNGFSDHYTRSMTLDELNVDRVFEIFAELDRQTQPLWDAWKADFDNRQAQRLGIYPEDLRPWHYTDPFFQEAPPSDYDFDALFAGKDVVELTRRYYAAIGLPIDNVLQNSDLFERPGKNQHAFCTDIDREGDVRVLCNVKPNAYWMNTMLHEYGHAVYDYYTDYSLPFLLRGPAHILSTEAIAEMAGAFATDEHWLQLYAGVDAGTAREAGRASHERNRTALLVLTRWILVMCHFEREMYRNPDQDLNSLWWDMVERYQSIRRPENRDSADWAAKLHLALAPVYYQNYLLGGLMAAQLLHHLKTVVLAGRPSEALHSDAAVGAWLKEKIFLQGALRPWEDGLEFAVGERMNPAFFTQELSA
jgi:peptidyl-dipeptidase A